jgi:toluene monooxygenase system ferredoxin subunit
MIRFQVLVDSFPIGKPVRVENGGRSIVVVRKSATEIYAFDDVCPHAGWRLSDGEIVDGRLECPGHGMQFELETGNCVDVDSHCLAPVAVTRVGEYLHFALQTEQRLKRGAA